MPLCLFIDGYIIFSCAQLSFYKVLSPKVSTEHWVKWMKNAEARLSAVIKTHIFHVDYKGRINANSLAHFDYLTFNTMLLILQIDCNYMFLSWLCIESIHWLFLSVNKRYLYGMFQTILHLCKAHVGLTSRIIWMALNRHNIAITGH